MRIAALLLFSLPAISAAQQMAIGEYAVPTAISAPTEIAVGPDGALWFTEYNAAKIGRITTAGQITEYPLRYSSSPEPFGITVGPDGALWFADYGDAIGRITTSGDVTSYSVRGNPAQIITGPDGALWFTENTGNSIGRITTAGIVTSFPVPTENNWPFGITTGPDGALWFTEAPLSGVGKIGRITTAGAITEYPTPTVNSRPAHITTGPDGALWFAEDNAGQIGRITTSGAFTEYPVPTPNSNPYGIATGPDGALWFTEQNGDKLGRITTGGEITEYGVPTFDTAPNGIVTGPDGELWFAETSDRIGEAVFVTAGLSSSPPDGRYRTNLTFSGSAFGPSESVRIYTSGVGSAILVGGTTDADGSFSATAHAVESQYGPRIFLGVGQTSGRLGAAGFSMAPRLIPSPHSGTAGSSVSVDGYGFGSLESVEVYWGSPRTLLGTVTANVHGTFNGSAKVTFTVPSGAPAGRNVLVGKGDSTKAIGYGSFTVK
jgi:streptogramin lyase